MKYVWISHLAKSNLRKHLTRNIFSIVSLIIGLSASFLIIGFSNNAKNSIKEESYHQFDYGSLTITKESEVKSNNGGLSIIRNYRPSKDDIDFLKSELKDFEIDLDLSGLVPNYSSIKYNDEILKDVTYECVYSFFDKYTDKNLLIEGEFPQDDSLEFVVVNDKFEKEFMKKYQKTSLGQFLNVHQESEHIYFLEDDESDNIRDYFVFDQKIQIVGIVKDLSFLSTPKIFYSYVALKDYLSNIYLNNLSSYFGKNYSWVKRIEESNDSDSVNGYSYRLFLKNIKDVNKLDNIIDEIKKPFSLDSICKTRTDALLNLVNAASQGMGIFLIISLIGTTLIMGIVSFSFYVEDKKVIAILSALGANATQINDIYCLENIIISSFSLIISFVISPFLQILFNSIIFHFSGFKNMIKIPFLSFLDIPLGLPLLIIFLTLLISLLSTLLPIIFSKKISIKEELKDE